MWRAVESQGLVHSTFSESYSFWYTAFNISVSQLDIRFLNSFKTLRICLLPLVFLYLESGFKIVKVCFFRVYIDSSKIRIRQTEPDAVYAIDWNRLYYRKEENDISWIYSAFASKSTWIESLGSILWYFLSDWLETNKPFPFQVANVRILFYLAWMCISYKTKYKSGKFWLIVSKEEF